MRLRLADPSRFAPVPSRPGPARGRERLVVALLLLLPLLGVGCASAPRPRSALPSFAFGSPEATALGGAFAAERDPTGRESSFTLLDDAGEALRVRAALIGLAERTIDLQTYVWERDAAGSALREAILAAADRGVRVRLLLDDIHTSGRDTELARLDGHPAVEVRLWNPFRGRDVRFFDWVFDLSRVNRRMHNKAMVADNALAVVGGRNVADHYFGIHASANFRDLDLFADGPIVREVSSAFDLYWNSPYAFPLGEAAAGTVADAAAPAVEALPEPLPASESEWRTILDALRPRLARGEARLLVDLPEKIDGDRRRSVAELLGDADLTPKRELLVESAYLVPGDEGVRRLADMVDAGVRVRVLTNSLATNDVAAAHGGWVKYRRSLLEAGVEVHELRPDARGARRRWSRLFSRSRAALHTKAFVVDRERVVIGSFNLDPRSADTNTEMGIVVESPMLAEQVARFVEEGMAGSDSWQLSLVDGEIHWVAADAEPIRLGREPDADLSKQLFAWVVSWLPVDGWL